MRAVSRIPAEGMNGTVRYMKAIRKTGARVRKLGTAYNTVAIVYSDLASAHGYEQDAIFGLLNIDELLKGDAELPWQTLTRTEDLTAARAFVRAFHNQQRLIEETVGICLFLVHFFLY